MKMNKEDVIEFVKQCALCEMYEVFDICRERHNDKMLGDEE